jgi:hypothetical protein
MLVASIWGDVWRAALAVFLLAVGLSAAYLLVRLGGTVARLSAFIEGAEREVLPVINKVGGSVDRVNGQLDKVDRITDSAGVSYGAADFKTKRSWRHAVEAGKTAAARREQELADELREAGEPS